MISPGTSHASFISTVAQVRGKITSALSFTALLRLDRSFGKRIWVVIALFIKIRGIHCRSRVEISAARTKPSRGLSISFVPFSKERNKYLFRLLRRLLFSKEISISTTSYWKSIECRRRNSHMARLLLRTFQIKPCNFWYTKVDSKTFQLRYKDAAFLLQRLMATKW